MQKYRIPFSRKALLLAPLPVPLAYSALLVLGMATRSPSALFLMGLTIGLIIAYSGIIVLIATLWLIAKARPITKTVTGITGFVLAGTGYVPIAWQNYLASGIDSGPPSGTFGAYLLHDWNDPLFYAFLIGGLATALIYHSLAKPPARA